MWSAPDRELGQVAPTVDDAPGGRPARRPKPEQRLKRGHRRLAPVMAKHELVEIDRQLMAPDPVVGPDQPLSQVADRSVYARQHGPAPGSNLLRTGNVVVASRREAAELLETVGVDRRPRGDVPFGKVGEGGLAEVGNDFHAGASRPRPALFHDHPHEGRFPPFQLATAAQTRLRPPHPRVVELDLPVQGLTRAVDHRPPELVQDQPGRLVPTDRQLSIRR